MDIIGEQLDAFRSLEEAMWISETRGDPAWMDVVLAPGFTEHGQSGKVHDRNGIIALPISDHIPVVLPMEDFVVRAIEPTVVLITYVSEVAGKKGNRSSIWRYDGERWLMEFHQGTPTLVEPPSNTIDTAALRTASFSQKLRGYDVESVDNFLQGMADQVESGTLIGLETVAEARFELALRGYACDEVDAFLADLKTQLRRI